MDCGLLIAAGGGGDAIAAAILHRALDDTGRRPVIATYSWDRLLIDPLPGPRDPSSFTGLERVGELNYRVTGDTKPIPPAGSTLPRLAAELDADLYLLDPRGGAVGLAEQLAELRDQLGTEHVTIVDVGGDILAEGREPTLRSPLADSLVLAATASLDGRVEVLVAGAGIDGELAEADVLQHYDQLGATLAGRLLPTHVEHFRPLFNWHPSEATGLLCAAASGTRGTAEMRDRGLSVTLSDHTADVYELSGRRVLSHNRLARALVSTRSLAEAVDALRAAGRDSEIDYERRKARRLNHETTSASTALPAGSLADRLVEVHADALGRGVDFITLRGLAERLGLPGTRLGELQELLRAQSAGEYVPPIWSLRPAEVISPAGKCAHSAG